VISGSLLTVAAVAIGFVYSGKESQAAKDVARHESEVDQATTGHLRVTHGGCSSLAPLPLPSACSSLSDSANARRDSRNAKVAAFSSAGILGIATIAAYLFWPTSESSERRAAVTLVPWNERGQGAQLRLSF
jgi:hypothetical protein